MRTSLTIVLTIGDQRIIFEHRHSAAFHLAFTRVMYNNEFNISLIYLKTHYQVIFIFSLQFCNTKPFICLFFPGATRYWQDSHLCFYRVSSGQARNWVSYCMCSSEMMIIMRVCSFIHENKNDIPLP